jgi:hypothetical protein
VEWSRSWTGGHPVPCSAHWPRRSPACPHLAPRAEKEDSRDSTSPLLSAQRSRSQTNQNTNIRKRLFEIRDWILKYSNDSSSKMFHKKMHDSKDEELSICMSACSCMQVVCKKKNYK